MRSRSALAFAEGLEDEESVFFIGVLDLLCCDGCLQFDVCAPLVGGDHSLRSIAKDQPPLLVFVGLFLCETLAGLGHEGTSSRPYPPKQVLCDRGQSHVSR